MQRLKSLYFDVVVPKFKVKFNDITVPYLSKIVINRGFDESCQNNKVLDSLVNELTSISAQRAYLVRSRKAISNFKLKENVPVGMCVTLRGEKMYAFLDRLINLALPRIRDFQGVNVTAFDQLGNYTLSLSESLCFPEVNSEKLNKKTGMDITLVFKGRSTKNTIQHFIFLLKELGIPFKS
uniref:Large ribosomal subunit protein uL5c n=1 Tax=Lepocinclis tripteris TaxID=135494 RepID=A0A3G3LKZ6_9EUGL|nr:ribosomal protein L5 [Lepocinclis tripteris]AYQ93378.1 ribosomal protein L5 [Lepocinclis tripteris]